MRELYLDLVKKCLMDAVYERDEFRPMVNSNFLRKAVANLLESRGLCIARVTPFEREVREQGQDHPRMAHTMIGLKRLNNIQQCVEDVIAKEVPGDLIETGVWRGGATIFMRAILKAHGVVDRVVWVADSFAGLPPPDPDKYPDDAGDVHFTFENLAVSLEEVKANFQQYGLLDEQVRFLKGWFSDTLPQAPISSLAVLRLDGDMYESTIDSLINLYPKLSVGGFIIIDDYGLTQLGCRDAVHDYRRQNGISDEIVQIDRDGVYWQKTKSS